MEIYERDIFHLIFFPTIRSSSVLEQGGQTKKHFCFSLIPWFSLYKLIQFEIDPHIIDRELDH